MRKIFLSLALLSSLVWNNSYATTTAEVVTGDTTINQLNTYSPKLSAVCTKFTRSFGFGSRGSDVSALQTLLIKKGYLSTNPTGYFGMMTKEALIKFQSGNGVRGTGYMGELSKVIANKHCEDTAVNGTSTQPTPIGCSTPPCKPTGIFCTMVARLCDDGTMMPRDASCGWHPEQCKASSGTSSRALIPSPSVPSAPPTPTH